MAIVLLKVLTNWSQMSVKFIVHLRELLPRTKVQLRSNKNKALGQPVQSFGQNVSKILSTVEFFDSLFSSLNHHFVL
jgi:hypothetical protein